MKKVKIIGYASDICWWQGHMDQECDVLDVYEPTGYIRIRFMHIPREVENCEDHKYMIDGWIEPKYVEIME